MSLGWPAILREGPLELRGLRRRDGPAWVEVRLRNEEWLRPWEASPPALATHTVARGEDWASRQTLLEFAQVLHNLRAQIRNGSYLPFGVFLGRQFVGQVNVGQIVRGPFNSGYVGYWVDRRVAGRAVLPTALAMVADHCFTAAAMHRIEANVRPENVASRRVMDKVGFTEEGHHRRYLAIDGDYRDHISYALLAEDVPEGVLARLRARGHAGPR